jgi:hypothetical protein
MEEVVLLEFLSVLGAAPSCQTRSVDLKGSQMPDLLATGPASLGGLLIGLAVAMLVHWLFPVLSNAYILYALLVAGGFLLGMVFDGRTRRR